jgi:hypothetical protein
LATIPSQRTWNAGETVTAAQLNSNVRDAVNFYKALPFGYAYRTAAQTVANGGSWTRADLDTEYYDNDAMYTTSTPGRITIVTPGLYFVEGQLRYSSSSSGTYRAARIQLTGTDVDTQYVPLAPSNSTQVYVKGYRQCVAGDYFEISGLHDHTAALSLAVGSYHYTFLRARFMGA